MRSTNGFRIDADEASSGSPDRDRIFVFPSANPVHKEAPEYPVRVTIRDSHFHKLWWGHGRGHGQIALVERIDLSVF